MRREAALLEPAPPPITGKRWKNAYRDLRSLVAGTAMLVVAGELDSIIF